MKHIIIITLTAALAAGCCSTSKPKPTLERGWIGGEYEKASRALVPEGHHSHVYVKRVYDDSPAAAAGLQSADLILSLDGTRVTGVAEFQNRIAALPLGKRGSIRILRNGEELDIPVVVGRERFQQWHSITFGLHLTTRLDLLPTPDFALGPIAHYRRKHDRLELRSPEIVLRRAARNTESQGETGVRSDEGWNFWLVILGFDAHKRILDQEAAHATASLSMR